MSENNRPNDDSREMQLPEEEEEDLIIFETEDGEELTFRLVDYFYYNGEEYALLTEAGDGEEDEKGLEVIVCRVVSGVDENGEETEEFVNIEDEDLAQKLIQIANTQLLEDEEADE